MEKERVITVLFTRYRDILSKCVYVLYGGGYTHVSISLDEKDEYFYSFNKKGFRKEYPKKHATLVKSMSYKIKVSEKDYLNMKEKLEEMKNDSEILQYSKLGILFCFLNIRFKRKNKYICSQFVAELLEYVESFELKKDPMLYSPNELKKLLDKCDLIKEIIYNPIKRELLT